MTKQDKIEALKAKQAEDLKALEASKDGEDDADDEVEDEDDGDDEVEASLSPKQRKELEAIAKEKAEKAVNEIETSISKGIASATEDIKAKGEKSSLSIISSRNMPLTASKLANEHLRLHLRASIFGEADVYAKFLIDKKGFTQKELEAAAADGVQQETGGGSNVVAQMIEPEIFWTESMQGFAQRELTTTTIAPGTKSVDFPTADSVAVYWVGETDAIGSAKPGLGQVKLEMKKMGTIVPFSTEVLDGAVVDLQSVVRSLIIDRQQNAIDRQIFSKDNTANRPTGIFATTGLVERTNNNAASATGRATALTPEQMAAWKKVFRDRANESADADKRFGDPANATFWIEPNLLDAMSVAQTNNIYNYPMLADGRTDPRYLRNPVRELSPAVVDTTKANEYGGIYGDLRANVIMGLSPTTRVDVSTEATVGKVGNAQYVNTFQQDEVALRVITQVGVAVLGVNELVALKLA